LFASPRFFREDKLFWWKACSFGQEKETFGHIVVEETNGNGHDLWLANDLHLPMSLLMKCD